MKFATVFLLCALLLIGICAIGQVQNKADSPPAVSAILLPDDSVTIARPAGVMAPEITQGPGRPETILGSGLIPCCSHNRGVGFGYDP